MASYKFVYTVSGIDLTDAQKAKISEEIAGVVTRGVLGQSKEAIRPDLLTLHGIAGGRMIPVDAKEATAFISGGCGGGEL
jgi:hypothetical protein